MRIARRLKPYHPKALQADATHTADADRSLGSQTASMGMRTLSHVYSRSFGAPNTAPKSTLTASNTWTGFILGDTADEGHIDDWHAPYYQQLDYAALYCQLTFVTVHWMRVALRLRTDDLPGVASGAASTQGRTGNAVYPVFGLTVDGWLRFDWEDATPRLGILTAKITTVGASSVRMLSVTPEIRVPTIVGVTNAMDIAGDWVVYCKDISIWGAFDPSVYGDG